MMRDMWLDGEWADELIFSKGMYKRRDEGHRTNLNVQRLAKAGKNNVHNVREAKAPNL